MEKRALKTREIMEALAVTIARRLTAIVLLKPALNANYFVIKKSSYPWPG
jgi:hypothetical protein